MAFLALSPDGVPITRDAVFPTWEAASRAIHAWVRTYEWQGFYSAIAGNRRERIPLRLLSGRCRIVECDDDPDEIRAAFGSGSRLPDD